MGGLDWTHVAQWRVVVDEAMSLGFIKFWICVSAEDCWAYQGLRSVDLDGLTLSVSLRNKFSCYVTLRVLKAGIMDGPMKSFVPLAVLRKKCTVRHWPQGGEMPESMAYLVCWPQSRPALETGSGYLPLAVWVSVLTGSQHCWFRFGFDRNSWFPAQRMECAWYDTVLGERERERASLRSVSSGDEVTRHSYPF